MAAQGARLVRWLRIELLCGHMHLSRISARRSAFIHRAKSLVYMPRQSGCLIFGPAVDPLRYFHGRRGTVIQVRNTELKQSCCAEFQANRTAWMGLSVAWECFIIPVHVMMDCATNAPSHSTVSAAGYQKNISLNIITYLTPGVAGHSAVTDYCCWIVVPTAPSSKVWARLPSSAFFMERKDCSSDIDRSLIGAQATIATTTGRGHFDSTNSPSVRGGDSPDENQEP
ncbi:hypothetical protein PCANC_18985 [Puccinia coronata f. sp. avenae]|uniref:Uncharacterized protein n=1 Tax=Puccinia coronata f. sp. avenae TaxID=200324 RepID=A0A2N5U3E1_9BASI|nr:hypothetical protein PCANC_18985 [Puccinia coronata f. sp. avenae]